MGTKTVKPTWKPYEAHGDLPKKDRTDFPETAFAFPRERKEPLTDARHVQNALARFDQVKDVSTEERDQAWANILAAARHFGVDVAEKDWCELGSRPHTPNPAHKGHHNT